MMALALATCSARGIAQTALDLASTRATTGRRTVTPGVTPDPLRARFVSEGTIDVRTLALGDGCVGYVARRPDYIVYLRGTTALLRFYVIAGIDTTLIVRGADRRWRCNDDSHGGANPTVDVTAPSIGRYDVWVGAYRANTTARGTLHVTMQTGNHP